METINYKQIRELFLAKRPRDSHKGDFGHVLIAAGSKGMAGAAILCARGALRAGAGLVTVSIHEDLYPIIQTAVPEAMCIGRSIETDITEAALKKYNAIALGPGLGASAKAFELVSWLLQKYTGHFVLDADALNIIAHVTQSNKNWTSDFPKIPPQSIATPHPGEAARLLGVDKDTINKNRLAALAALKEKLGCTICLKGYGTLVTPEYVNPNGNPGMATGGSGDVLTGVIASLLAQGLETEEAARAGVYIHGLAGDMAAQQYGEHGLTAGDIAEHIAYAIKKISNEPRL